MLSGQPVLQALAIYRTPAHTLAGRAETLLAPAWSPDGCISLRGDAPAPLRLVTTQSNQHLDSWHVHRRPGGWLEGLRIDVECLLTPHPACAPQLPFTLTIK